MKYTKVAISLRLTTILLNKLKKKTTKMFIKVASSKKHTKTKTY